MHLALPHWDTWHAHIMLECSEQISCRSVTSALIYLDDKSTVGSYTDG